MPRAEPYDIGGRPLVRVGVPAAYELGPGRLVQRGDVDQHRPVHRQRRQGPAAGHHEQPLRRHQRLRGVLHVVHLHEQAERGGDAAEEGRAFGESSRHVVLVDPEGTQEPAEHRGEIDRPVPAVILQVDVELAVREEPRQFTADGLGDELGLADPADRRAPRSG
ncbi:hypothetical protein ACFCZ4_14760 [Streptomyces microflavus]|uniref:hypothetical protein n=1 Tax=Streptomyces microflavus TaxID=1919 RepID=UPI0035DA4B06